MDIWDLMITAVTGLAAAVLTYLATRRQTQVNERAVYVQAMEALTRDLRGEIDRVNAARKAEVDAREAAEDRVQALLVHVDRLEAECRQLRAHRASPEASAEQGP